MKENTIVFGKKKIDSYKENLKKINFNIADKYRDGFYTKANDELRKVESGEMSMDDVFFNPDSPLRNMIILAHLDATDYRTSLKHNPIKEQMIQEADIMNLNELPFKDTIQKMGGKIYSVGGAVRDEFLGKESKDLDILITGIPMDKLEQTLSRFGKVDAVGKSFGILKFKPEGATEDIDVAIPRTEVATGDGGHKGFDVTSDHNLSIEDDLRRRDFTFNAMAKDIDGNLIDPFGGQKDLKDGVIKLVNPEAFSDDPLRMIRAVQFAARFGMNIDVRTKDMIKQNAGRIKEIAGERILEELRKVVDKKGDPLYAADLLRETGLYENIFGTKSPAGMESHWDSDSWNNINTLGEFVFMLLRPITDKPADMFKSRLKGDIPTSKEIMALNRAWLGKTNNVAKNRGIVHNMHTLSPNSLDSNILSVEIKNAAQDLKSGKYPKSLRELAVNGNDLMKLGLKGKEVGDTLKNLLIKVYADKIKNNREDLLSSIDLS
jgi:tRNA nucleotidyltransferase (CCA-adding enzyme)